MIGRRSRTWSRTARLTLIPPGSANALHPRCNGDTVAVNQIAVRDHIAHVDGEAETQEPISRRVGALLRHCPLDRDRAAHGIDDARPAAVAHRTHDAAPVLGDRRVDDIVAHRSERRQCALLVETRVKSLRARGSCIW